jgi:hypothetical protein
MYEYGVYFWSAVVSFGLLVPVIVFVAQEVSKAAACVKRHLDGDHPSHPSVDGLPVHSSPSSVG